MGRTESERAKRDGFRPSRFLSLIAVFAVSFLLCAYLLPIKQAKANPAIAAPFFAAACEAAGISATDFALGMTAIITATTGMSIIGAAYEYEANISIPVNLRHWKTPGWKDWEDMTPQEKQDTGCESNYEYYLKWLENYMLYYGMITNDQTDPNEPPEPHFDDNTVRRVKTLMMTSGGVALADFSYPAAKGTPITAFNVPYSDLLVVDGIPVVTTIVKTTYFPTDRAIQYQLTESANTLRAYFYTGGNQDDFATTPIVLKKNSTTNPTAWKIQSNLMPSGTKYYKQIYIRANGNVSVYTGDDYTFTNNELSTQVSSTYYPLNAIYDDVITFQTDQGTAEFYNNEFVSYDIPAEQTIDYGQISGAPSGIVHGIPSVENINNYFENVNMGLPEGQQNYIVLPDLSYINNPTYDDFVQVREDSQTNTDPENPINPDTGTDVTTPSNEDFKQRFQRIIAQPFEAAFPFCLIEDARQLFMKLDAYANAEPDFTVTLPLTDFNVNGAQEVEIDASDLKVIGGYVKIAINILWVSILIAFAYKLFLKRGE